MTEASIRRIACVVVVGGVIAVLACDASSPVAPPQQPTTVFAPSIAFESNRDGSPAVYVANEDGSGVTRLASGTAPAWSRDGSRIAYYWGGDVAHPAGVYIIDPESRRRRWLVSAQDWGGRGPNWGPADREIAYRGDGGIFTISADGSAPPRMLIGDDLALPREEGWDPNDYAPGWVDSPDWSPDGGQIAFVRSDPWKSDWGTDWNTYVLNADGSDPRLLERSCAIPSPGAGSVPCAVTSLAWSPSGQSLVVTSFDIDAETGGYDAVLGIMPASFGPHSADALSILYRGIDYYDGAPQWSPDASAIVFGGYPHWAPDGSRGTRIFVISLDNGLVRQLIPDVAHPVLTVYTDRRPAWRRAH